MGGSSRSEEGCLLALFAVLLYVAQCATPTHASDLSSLGAAYHPPQQLTELEERIASGSDNTEALKALLNTALRLAEHYGEHGDIARQYSTLHRAAQWETIGSAVRIQGTRATRKLSYLRGEILRGDKDLMAVLKARDIRPSEKESLLDMVELIPKLPRGIASKEGIGNTARVSSAASMKLESVAMDRKSLLAAGALQTDERSDALADSSPTYRYLSSFVTEAQCYEEQGDTPKALLALEQGYATEVRLRVAGSERSPIGYTRSQFKTALLHDWKRLRKVLSSGEVDGSIKKELVHALKEAVLRNDFPP
jgi:hypothetical protein